MIEQAQTLYKQAQESYPTLKKEIEAKVVRWFWVKGGIGLFSLEPFYFEQNRFSKGKILKEAPECPEENTQYGVNVNDEIIVERRYTGLKGLYYESFYFREEYQVVNYTFDYAPEKGCINVRLFSYHNGQLQAIYAAFKNDKRSEKKMFYKGEQLVRCEWKGKDNHLAEDSFERVFNYSYSPLGELETITSNDGKVWYQKKNKKISYKKLSEKVAERVYKLLISAIKEHPVNEPLYCLNIAFSYQYIMPPMIGLGNESQRQERKKQYGKKADDLLWNTANYEHTIEITANDEDDALFELFNQETIMQEKEAAAEKLLIGCGKHLKKEWASLGILQTDDFVVVISDIEESMLEFIK